ncbi:MAG TPA: outer membrane lipoprotein carrier protein LolA [Brumimicrobium sp.]|nr:outer membrane lipoprotein carrier protein LolA [Brumimicrobium sp.]
MRYLLLGILFLTSTVFAQSDQKSKEILDKISTEIKGLKSFYMEFDMSSKNSSTGENTNQKGTGYVKGNKYFATLGDLTLISNGVKSWTVIKDEKMTYQNDVDEDDDDAITPKKLMTIWEKGFKSKYEKETTINGKKVHQISLFPTNPGKVNYHTITLFVGVQGNDLYRAIMKTKDGGVMTYTIGKLDKTATVADSKFVYNPQNYPGYQLIRD